MDDDTGGDTYEVCEDCGSELLEEAPAFGLPDGLWLCHDCAHARGGEYDATDEVWIRPPRVDALGGPDT